MSAFEVKRTWPIAVHMSAFDPKRTLLGPSRLVLNYGRFHFRKYGKFNYLKKFCFTQIPPLEKIRPFPKSIAAGCQQARCGRRRMSGALLISMLLNGGCGYEDDEPRPLLADKYWL
jgi:hypothetical protein